MCDWFDRYNRNEEPHRREGPELSTEDLTNLAHRKDPTATGDRMRENEENCKTIAQVWQEAKFSAEVGQGQYFVTRPSIKSSEGSRHECRQKTQPRSDSTVDKEFRRVKTRMQTKDTTSQ